MNREVARTISNEMFESNEGDQKPEEEQKQEQKEAEEEDEARPRPGARKFAPKLEEIEEEGRREEDKRKMGSFHSSHSSGSSSLDMMGRLVDPSSPCLLPHYLFVNRSSSLHPMFRVLRGEGERRGRSAHQSLDSGIATR